MTTAGWVIMLFSVGSISVLLIWSVWKVLRTEQSELHLKAPVETDPDDRD